MVSITEEKDAIRELLYSYAFFAESGLGEEWVGLFTADAVWYAGKLGRHEGYEGIRTLFSTSDPTHQHVTSNTIISVDGETAHALSHVTLNITSKTEYRNLGGGYYMDQLVKQNGCWKFRRRTWRLRLTPEDLVPFKKLSS